MDGHHREEPGEREPDGGAEKRAAGRVEDACRAHGHGPEQGAPERHRGRLEQDRACALARPSA